MLHHRRTWNSVIVTIACCTFACASHAGTDQELTLRLERVPEQVRVVEQADTLAALIVKLKPTLVFNRRDMLWAGVDEEGLPEFTLARAHLLEVAGGKPAWVVLEYRPEATPAPGITQSSFRATLRGAPFIRSAGRRGRPGRAIGSKAGDSSSCATATAGVS